MNKPLKRWTLLACGRSQHWIWAAGMGLCLWGALAVAQAPSPRVQDLIEAAKRQREAQLGIWRGTEPAPAATASERPGQAPQVKPRPVAPPLVWSLSGLGQEFSAILVYNQKAHVVHSSHLPQYVGPWRITNLSKQGVQADFRRSGPRTGSAFWPAPMAGSTADVFVLALPAATEDADEALSASPPPATPAVSGTRSAAAALAAALNSPLPAPARSLTAPPTSTTE